MWRASSTSSMTYPSCSLVVLELLLPAPPPTSPSTSTPQEDSDSDCASGSASLSPSASTSYIILFRIGVSLFVVSHPASQLFAVYI